MNSIAALDKLPVSVLSNDPASDFGKRWQVLALELDELRAVFETLRYISDPSLQTGNNLDNIGENYLQKRNGLPDDRYRIYLAIALEKLKAKGDIYTMNQVGSLILGSKGTLYSINELCYKNEPLYLDGSWLLNAEIPLSGSSKRPATLEIVMVGGVDTLEDIPEYITAIKQIRAGGVNVLINYKFEIEINSGLVYNPNTPITPFEIAVGSGGEAGGNVIPPGSNDTTLFTETLRKLAVSEINPDGTISWKIKIKQSELIGSSINEIGIFSDANALRFKRTFLSKIKDSDSTYEFIIKGII